MQAAVTKMMAGISAVYDAVLGYTEDGQDEFRISGEATLITNDQGLLEYALFFSKTAAL